MYIVLPFDFTPLKHPFEHCLIDPPNLHAPPSMQINPDILTEAPAIVVGTNSLLEFRVSALLYSVKRPEATTGRLQR